MKDKAILAWANKMLRSFPAQWQGKMRIPQFRVEEALDEVTKGYNMAEEHIRHMETQTRDELAKMLEGSVQKTLDKAQADLIALREESDAKDIVVEDFKQKLEDADKDIANLRNDLRNSGDENRGGATW